ncbi:uncharacterized protein LOC127110041 [Lathyrus oleraceus]|uniref:uncharacterized protein LOC127110041 n=1 Tax=Pisum sativum TaxID=3888 RepID=UPI0021D0247C|nr:uncharacterized protein LOC127110041 [Pisum sativum]
MKEVKCLSPLFVWMKMLDKGNDNFGIFNAKADEGKNMILMITTVKYVDDNYQVWHGEATKKRPLSHIIEDGELMNDTLKDISCDIKVVSFKNVNVVDTLQRDMEDSLYPGYFENLTVCLRCGESHYNKKDNGVDDYDGVTSKGVPTKVMWYLPIIPRFKRLFANVSDLTNTRWHADERVCDGKIRYLSDSLQWSKIDSLHPNFAIEPRNLRLGLSTDGMNPFGDLSTNHTPWHVLLILYNLSLWLCMKRKYMMLLMMISVPKQPGNDIDVYLTPLIEYLRLLWEKGVNVDEVYTSDNFKLCAMLFCTINDFLAYCNLYGYNAKGHKMCLICEVDTCHHQLQNGKKTVYLGHQNFLRPNHPYRRLQKTFNGKQNLDVRYYLNVKHVKKNVSGSLIETLLNIKGKTKDTKKSLKDMVLMVKLLMLGNLDGLEHEAAVILCQLEMFFIPSFFEIMVHLVVHPVRENGIYGLVYLRWMHPIERYIKFLKGCTKNHHRLNVSIVERYITKEAIEFCTNYLLEAFFIGIHESRHDGFYDGRGIHGLNLKTFSREVVLQAHLHILNNFA